MDQRAKGEDVVISIFKLVGGQRQKIQDISDIKSYEITFNLDLLKEGYLGQTTDRLDDIFRGVSGSLEYHFSDAGALKLIQSIVQRARTRAGATNAQPIVISHQATIYMPDGTRPIISVPSMFFGPIPLGFGAREQFGSVKLDWSGEDAQFVGLG